MSVFEKLNKINVNNYTEKKGQFTYLSWAWAVRELLKVAPNSTWTIHEWGEESNRQPYMQTKAGCFVQVTVTVDGVNRTQVHPVLDNNNKAVLEPDAFQINTSIQRCLAKAIALHGLGLYIYAGEDSPLKPEPITNEQYKEITKIISSIKNFDGSKIVNKINEGLINQSNFRASISKLKRLASKK